MSLQKAPHDDGAKKSAEPTFGVERKRLLITCWFSTWRGSANGAPPHFPPNPSPTHNSANMDPIDKAIEEIKSRGPGEEFSYRKIAKKYGVPDTTLRRIHQGKNVPIKEQQLQRRKLTP
jgi:hypothetical protein